MKFNILILISFNIASIYSISKTDLNEVINLPKDNSKTYEKVIPYFKNLGLIGTESDTNPEYRKFIANFKNLSEQNSVYQDFINLSINYVYKLINFFESELNHFHYFQNWLDDSHTDKSLDVNFLTKLFIESLESIDQVYTEEILRSKISYLLGELIPIAECVDNPEFDPSEILKILNQFGIEINRDASLKKILRDLQKILPNRTNKIIDSITQLIESTFKLYLDQVQEDKNLQEDEIPRSVMKFRKAVESLFSNIYFTQTKADILKYFGLEQPNAGNQDAEHRVVESVSNVNHKAKKLDQNENLKQAPTESSMQAFHNDHSDDPLFEEFMKNYRHFYNEDNAQNSERKRRSAVNGADLELVIILDSLVNFINHPEVLEVLRLQYNIGGVCCGFSKNWYRKWSHSF